MQACFSCFLEITSEHSAISTLDVSYNRPSLCANTTWNETGSTFVDNNTLGIESGSIFIDTEDTVYYADRTNRRILIWPRGNNQKNATALSDVAMSAYSPLFVSINGDIYYSYGFRGGRVIRRSASESQPSQVALFARECYGLFVDRYKTLYCSVKDKHHVATTLLYGNRQVNTIRAGTGTNGSAANQLSSPWGIFVDIDLALFIADADNHRIQLFLLNQTNGSTVAGNNTPCGLQLNYPTDVVVDGSGFIFIADSGNHHVVRVGWSGYRCVAGCQSQAASGPSQVNQPSSLRLDSSGNLWVADENNRRIQKFVVNSQCNRAYAFASSGANASMSCPIANASSSQPNPAPFQPRPCPSPQRPGLFCNVTNTPCLVFSPCQNNGSCFHVSNNTRGYWCSCPSGFGGDDCQYDLHSCGKNPCLFNGQSHLLLCVHLICLVVGTCQSLINGTIACRCVSGREGSRCERRTDFCSDVKCENDGVCQSRSVTYQCLCVSDSYSGVYCEVVSGKIRMYRISALTIACASIAMIVGCATFVVVMDVLKYVFGIHVAKVKQFKKRRHNPKGKGKNLSSWNATDMSTQLVICSLYGSRQCPHDEYSLILMNHTACLDIKTTPFSLRVRIDIENLATERS